MPSDRKRYNAAKARRFNEMGLAPLHVEIPVELKRIVGDEADLR